MIKNLHDSFIPPEKTRAGINFCDIPIQITYEQAKIILMGVPIDITTTFGKSASLGPVAIRTTSAEQIETLIFEKNVEIFEKSMIFDIGDFIVKGYEEIGNMDIEHTDQFWSEFDYQMNNVIRILLNANKVPVILGGEHTLSYSTFKSLSHNHPLLIHFDAHRDMKPIYKGKKICHTTPFYHLINENHLNGEDLVQIGIRQADAQENRFAIENNVHSFDAWDCHRALSQITDWITNNTKNRNIYISFDIDVYDIQYLPCTGTPEPFGLNPFQILKIISSIHPTANIIGIDLVETGLKNNDYREGTLATHTLLRILSSECIKK